MLADLTDVQLRNAKRKEKIHLRRERTFCLTYRESLNIEQLFSFSISEGRCAADWPGQESLPGLTENNQGCAGN